MFARTAMALYLGPLALGFTPAAPALEQPPSYTAYSDHVLVAILHGSWTSWRCCTAPQRAATHKLWTDS